MSTENITLYSTGCPKCKVLKKKLAEKALGYTEITSVQDMLSIGISSAPALKVGDKLYNFAQACRWIGEQ